MTKDWLGAYNLEGTIISTCGCGVEQKSGSMGVKKNILNHNN